MATLTRIDNMSARVGRPHIVFVHGLGGDARTTWMSDPKNPATLWPQWLAEDSGCPVWLLGYDAALSGWKEGAMPLPSQGATVLEALTTAPGLQGQPLVLIGHSMGGLVIKTALLDVRAGGTKRFEWVIDSIKGVVFIGTPHFGSDLATLASTLKVLLRTNEQVGDMQTHDAYLRKLNQQFMVMQQDLGFRMRTFAETTGVELPGWKSLLGFRGPTVQVVSPTSSEPGQVGEPAIMLPGNHFSICKPESRDAQIYVSVKAFVQEVLQGDGQNLDPKLYVDSLPIGMLRLAVAWHGLDEQGAPSLPMVASACVTTDDGTALGSAVDAIRDALERSSLLPEAARQRVKGATLTQLAADRTLRGPLLDQVATLGFSAYVYFGPADALRPLDAPTLHERLLEQPVLHRLRKKSDRVVAAFGPGDDWPARVEAALAQARAEAPQRTLVPITTVRASQRADRSLLELAELVATIVSQHLGDPKDEDAQTAFDHLWTRIRYGENVLTRAVPLACVLGAPLSTVKTSMSGRALPLAS